MEKEILLNDQDLKVKCILDNNRLSFEFDKNLEFLNDLFRIERTDNLIFVYLGLKKILRIEGDSIERILPVSDTEVRVLRALYENNKGMNSINIIDCFNNVKNNNTKSGFSFKFLKLGKAKTESHTVLTEILDAEELIRFLNEYDIRYPMNEYGILDFNCDNYYTYEQVKYNGWLDNLENAIRVNLARKVDYRDIVQANKNREKLLKLACVSLEDMLGDTVEWKKIESDIRKASEDIIDQIKDIDDNLQGKSRSEKKRLNKGKNKLNEKLNKLNNLKSAQASKILYNELLNISLDKLTNNKVSYSVISFSNDARIDFMSRKHLNDKRFSFIYNIDKDKSVKKYEDYAKSLEELFDTGMLIGADITGFEVYDEKEYNSLKEKFETILPVLRIHQGSVLRIHASNYTDSSNNIHKALTCMRDAINNINEACVDLFGSEWGTLNPPALRIAHPINFENHADLVNLVKAFDACIEYDLSSNKALTSVDSNKISLSFYEKADIKYVFSNDGGAMFYTDYNQDLIGAAEIHDTIKELKEITDSEEEQEEDLEPVELDNVFDTFKDEKEDEVLEPKPVFEAFKEEVPVVKEEVVEETTIEEPVLESPILEPTPVEEEVKEVEEETTEEDEDDIFDNINVELDQSALVDNDVYTEDELEKTLYDLFADLRKDKKEENTVEEPTPVTFDEVNEEDDEPVFENFKLEPEEESDDDNPIPIFDNFREEVKHGSEIDSYDEALEEENILFTRDGVLLSEKDKVEDELKKVQELMDLNPDLDMGYINRKINTIRSLNENSHTSDNAKMYLFLLEREMFPDLVSDLKSVEYLYNHKDNEKNNIEKELNRIFNLVCEQYDDDLL